MELGQPVSPVKSGNDQRQGCYGTVATTEDSAPSSFQLSGHGMGRAAFAARCVILVNDATLGCLVQSGSKYSQFGFDFALISSGDRRIQLFLLRFNSG